MCCAPAATPSTPRSPRADVVGRRVAADRAGRRRLHARAHVPAARRTCSTSSSRRRGRARPAASRPTLRADRRPLLGGRDPALQRRPASCGAYGNPLGIAQALEALRLDAARRPRRARRRAPRARASRSRRCRRFLFEVLEPILAHTEERGDLRARRATCCDVGETIRHAGGGRPARAARRGGPGVPLRGRRRAARSSDWVLRARRAAHDARTSRPTEWSSASRRGRATTGREILTNPPPSSGGILIAYSLDLMERLDPPAEHRLRTLVRDGPDEQGAHEGLRRGPPLRGLPRAVPRAGGARVGGARGAHPARQHDPPIGDGRGRRCASASPARTARARA